MSIIISLSFNNKVILFSYALITLSFFYYLSFKKDKFKRWLGILGAFYGVIYIFWRIIYTLPSVSTLGFVFGIILVLFELLALGQSLVFKMLFSSNKNIEINKNKPFDVLPSVDIIISTYNEPEDILKRTVVGCKKIDYPVEKLNIYLGDDGKRDEIKELANFFGIHYVTRQDNSHAKAGNINNVLSQSSGEFILVLDADMIPKKSIIKEMIGYFEDSKTGFVQSPQVFYNLDPFQYNLGLGEDIPNEQDFFMRTIEEKRALYNAVLHVGTNAIFRRSALDEIGGIPTGSITEDMATGMLIQNAGYKSYFVKNTLALGLSVEGIEDFIKQRDRWLRGNVQVIKKFNPIRMKGLNWIQKVIYLDGFVYWMFGLQKMVYIIAPLLYLLFKIKIFEADGLDIGMMFLPYFLSNSLYFKRISDKSRNITWSHIYDTAIAPQMAISFLTEFFTGKKLKFNVTPKGLVNEKDSFRIRLAFIHILLFTLSIIAIFINIYFIWIGKTNGMLFAILINLSWCFYNVFAIFISIFLYIDKKRFRKSERIPTNLKAKSLIKSCPHNKDCSHCGYVTDISEKGAHIKIKEYCQSFTFKEGSDITISIENIGEIQGEIMRISKINKNYDMGVSFKPINFETFSKINEYRFDLNNKYIRNYSIDTKMDSFMDIIYKILLQWNIKQLKGKILKQKV